MSTALVEPKTSNGRIDPDALFEIIDGIEVEMPPMSLLSEKVALRLFTHMVVFIEDHPTGEAQLNLLFKLPAPVRRGRRPDVSYVSYERWPKTRPIPPRANGWDVVPELAVEVISPSDFADDVMEKVGEYFLVEVRQVWVIYCMLKQVHVYDSLKSSRILTEFDTLEGGEILPGFSVRVADLFPPVLPPEPLPSDQE